MAKLAACLFLLAALALPAASQSARTRVIVVLIDGLTLADLTDPSLPNLDRLARMSQTALMNTAVAGPRSSASATFTLALGSLAPSEPTDFEIYEAHENVERTTAANVYRRRIGPLPKEIESRKIDVATPLVHIGWAPLMRRGLDRQLMGPALSRSQIRGFLAVRSGLYKEPEGREIGLFSVDDVGVGSAGFLNYVTKETDTERMLRFVDHTDFNLAYKICGKDLRLLDGFLAGLFQRQSLQTTRLMVVAPQPASAADGTWDRLSVALFAGPGLRPGRMISPTTRTPGLIANIDIAPTLLSWVSGKRPAGMTGQPVLEAPAASPSMRALKRMDNSVHYNARALVPVFAVIGFVAAVVAALGFSARLQGRPSRVAAFGILFLMSMPLAMLFAAPIEWTSVAALGAAVAGFMAVVAALAAALSRDRPERGPLAIAALTSAAVIADAFFGQPLVKFSLFSAYQLQGIRFYGIGNEYMGVVIGCVLLVTFFGRVRPSLSAPLMVVVAFTLGWPGLGANAGGLVTATVAFSLAGLALTGRRPGARAAALAAIVGLTMAFGLAFLDKRLAGAGASHLGGALSAAGERGWTYLGEIVARKLAMNLRILTHPAALTAIAGLGLILLAGSRRGASLWRRLAADWPGWKSGLPAASWGALAALLFNDSGIVAALFLIGTYLAAAVHLLFLQGQVAEAAGAESGTLNGN